MFSAKGAITVLLAGAASLWLAAGQAHAQGRGGCGTTQRGTSRGTGQQVSATQMSSLLTTLQRQQQNATLSAQQQQQLGALLRAQQQQQLTALQQQRLNALVLTLQQQQQNALLIAALQQSLQQ